MTLAEKIQALAAQDAIVDQETAKRDALILALATQADERDGVLADGQAVVYAPRNCVFVRVGGQLIAAQLPAAGGGHDPVH